ncbi:MULTISPECIES: type II secretion system secretin GspD [Rheinheimera]|jgi:general secretion pathway protein D|uniref:Type II secretion system protein GspD n=1 Tax=Rheinheimera tangshanensis TaxID=400153 RepID=A0A5C8LUI4_9GAMM|nr:MULTISPECIES: type II secretion system secretin GspD [Rheinheimera]KOO59360.1 general secretion pathway protein GspD [Rheinheimera sp. KL1]TXK79262.1 type II secretion system protein GspD [Rheinheimera tangshanensis]GGM68621.1 type II secretion system protein GspD [Rheinheimera tangshanensis]
MKSVTSSRLHISRWLGLSAIALLSFFATATEYQPNFKGTDINEFINIVGKNLNKTIIVDPQVRGRINVRSYEMLNEKQYYQFFLNVLEVYDFSVVEMKSGVLKVVRQKDAKTSNIPVVSDNAGALGDEMVTRVVQVKNVSVRELAPLLRQFVDQSGGGSVVNYDPSNVIMMTGQAETVNRLVDIISRVDKAGDQDLEIIKLSYASSAEVVRILENIYKNQGKSEQPEFLIPKIVADERTNSVIVSGERQARERVVALVQRLDAELENQGNTRVYYLKYAKAEDLVKVLQGVSATIAAETQGAATQAQSARTSGKGRDVSIEAHAESNSLVITAQPDVLRSLEDVIRQVDIRRAQVLVEAIIVEVADNSGANLGVQWISAQGGLTQFNNGVVPISQVAAGAAAAREVKGTTVVNEETGVTTVNPDQNGDYTQLGEALGGVTGMMLGVVKNDWGAILQAVTTDSNSNILATPSLTTLDNQESSFIVGEEVPIKTTTSPGSGGTNPFTTLDRIEVGIKLKVTPQINEGNAVKLTIEQEVSGRNGDIEGNPIIAKREIKTTVLADNGATVVLGGLIDEDVQQSESKVPLLGDIPVLGALFRSTSSSKRKRNLMIFIKPTIMRDDGLLSEVSQRKYNYVRAQQLAQGEKGINLMPGAETPAMPEFDETLIIPPTFDEYLQKKQAQDKAVVEPVEQGNN